MKPRLFQFSLFLRPALVVSVLLAGGLTNASANSLGWVQNSAGNFDHARQLTLPAAFGQGEFTLELWIRPDHTLPVGSTVSPPATTLQKLTNWASTDAPPPAYQQTPDPGWWWYGNFLLDGFNNNATDQGTFALQFYGGGRVRWLFGDGTSIVGGVRSVGGYPASLSPFLLDGQWHQLTLVRRWTGTRAAQLELWIDGILIDTEVSPARVNMRQWWDSWPGFPAGEAGWFWGAEKQAAVLPPIVWEDYKGLLDEIRFWSRAKSPTEIQTNWNQPLSGSESNLVGRYSFGESSGTSAMDSITGATMNLFNTTAAVFVNADAPMSGAAGPIVIVDNENAGATKTGTWTLGSGSGYYGSNYIHDGNAAKGSRTVRFTPNLPIAGSYEVFAWWVAGSNRATNVPIDIINAGTTGEVEVNQRLTGSTWVSLGRYNFNSGSGGGVLVSNAGTNGYVIADAIRFTPLLLNPGFETDASGAQSISGWSESGGHPEASRISSSVAPRAGTRYLAHSLSSSYNVFTYQTRTGLPNGSYTLRAWVQRSNAANGQTQTAAQMEASGFGGRTGSRPSR